MTFLLSCKQISHRTHPEHHPKLFYYADLKFSLCPSLLNSILIPLFFYISITLTNKHNIKLKSISIVKHAQSKVSISKIFSGNFQNLLRRKIISGFVFKSSWWLFLSLYFKTRNWGKKDHQNNEECISFSRL